MATTTETTTIPFLLTLNPTVKQAREFRGMLGAVRFAYNNTLAHVYSNWEENKNLPKEQQNYVDCTPFGLDAWMRSVKDEIAPWNRQYSKYVFESGTRNAGNAFTNVRKSNNGTRAGKKVGLPKYKSRKNENQIGVLFQNLKIENNKVSLPIIKWVKFFDSDKTILWLLASGARITQGTLKFQHDKWTFSLNLKMSNELARTYYLGKYKLAQRNAKHSVGGDVGIKSFLTLSDGTVFLSPAAYKKTLAKLRRANKRLARRSTSASKVEYIDPNTGEIKHVWSKRHDKAVKQVRKVNAKIYNQRKNFTNEVSKHLAMNYDIVGLEDLNISGMVKNRRLSQSISDASWGEFSRQVEYKLQRVGGMLVKIGRFEPTSKTCSECGIAKTKLALSERTFDCEACGYTADRDLNAAINIHKLAVKVIEQKQTLALQVAGSINARGVESTGFEALVSDSETMLRGSEKRTETKPSLRKTNKSSKPGSAKITTILA